MKESKIIKILIIFVIVLSFGVLFGPRIIFEPTQTNVEQDTNVLEFEIVAQDLNIPWEIDFLPDGSIILTERVGNLVRIGEDNRVIKVDGVRHTGEGGLLGLALHPNFEKNKFLYLYFTSPGDSGLINRVERYSFDGNSLSDRLIIIDDIPGASFHDGGRIRFGPDYKLYITTGDAGNEQSAQNIDSLAGKILRLNDDGSIPDDNPFGNEVWSYGHRNPQGITWDLEGRLWSTEHGPSGLKSGEDEVNLIIKGENYGWPDITGDQKSEGMVSPSVNSGKSDTWAPSGLDYFEEKLFFVGLRGESLYVVNLEDDSTVEIKSYLREDYGRLRIAKVGPDGYLYIGTSNRDGRGSIRQNDDKILRISLDSFD